MTSKPTPSGDTAADPATGHAFISYVRADAAVVDELQAALENAGIAVWRDVQDLFGGDDWQRRIRDAITKDAVAVVAVFSSRSTSRSSSYQHEELTLAVGAQRLRPPEHNFIVPVRIDRCAIPAYELRPGQALDSLHRIDLFPDRSTGINSVIASVKHILAEPKRPVEQPPRATEAPSWFAARRSFTAEINAAVGPGWLELAAWIDPPLDASKADLLDAVRDSLVDTFGWPLGLALDTGDNPPHPTKAGIASVIAGQRFDHEAVYDDWELRTDGSYHLIKHLFEDQRGRTNVLFVDTRVVRATEALMFLGRLYTALGADPTAAVHVRLSHGGLEGRHLAMASRQRHLAGTYRSRTSEITATVSDQLAQLEANAAQHVPALVGPLLELFDFFRLDSSVYDDMIGKFAGGQMP